ALGAAGIAQAIVALPPPGVDRFDRDDGVAVARACNDELAVLTGERFAGLATLPLQAPADAAAELERAVALGLPGAQVWSNAAGAPLDHLADLLDTAAALDIPLVLHPTLPVDSAALGDYGLLTTLGFLYETTTCAMRLIMSGLYERHPDFKLLVPHAGSLIPYLIGRIDYESRLFGAAPDLSAPPSEYARRLYTDSVCLWPPALRLALDVLGPERVLFGTDYPFWEPAPGVETLEILAPGERDLVCSVNARRLFGV